MQGIYTYIPETNHVPREYSVSAILSLLFMVSISIVLLLLLLLLLLLIENLTAATFRRMLRHLQAVQDHIKRKYTLLHSLRMV